MEKRILFLVFAVIFIFVQQSNGQINLNKVKGNTTKIVVNKKNKQPETENKTVENGNEKSNANLEDKGAEKAAEGNYLSALKYYKAALAKNSGDYSISQKVKEMERNVENQYMTKLSDEIEKGNCQQAQTDLDSVMAVMEYWGQEKYYRSEIEKCNTNSSSKVNNVVYNASDNQAGKIYFYTKFKDFQFTEKVPASDELFAKINLGKTMMEYSADLGLSSTFNAYGFFKFYINDKLISVVGPYQFTSNYSKVWNDFDIPLTINSDFPKKLQENPDLLSQEQDIWLLQQLFIENSINMEFTIAEILNLKNGNNKIIVEFGLGESEAKEPAGIIASGEIIVSMDDNNKKELYKRGPKYLRPLDNKDIGNFKYNATTLNIGSNAITTKLELPNPPKFYNVYWCKANTCDYDHGNLNFYAELDGKFLAAWTSEFDGDAYESQKSFNLTILPANDKDFESNEATFNSEDLFHRNSITNPLPYALYDLIYSGQMKSGNHTLKIKTYSTECIPYSASFENTSEFHNKWYSIAETTVNLNLTESARQQLISSSSAKKLSHAGGEWTSVDNYLKTSISPNGGSVIIDVAAQTEWKVTVNILNLPVYRTCKADILYKTANGAYRIARSVLIKEDYTGSYGKPFVGQIVDYNTISFMLNPMEFPVPESKIK